jgi:hypothetical protein
VSKTRSKSQDHPGAKFVFTPLYKYTESLCCLHKRHNYIARRPLINACMVELIEVDSIFMYIHGSQASSHQKESFSEKLALSAPFPKINAQICWARSASLLSRPLLLPRALRLISCLMWQYNFST